MIRTKIDGFKQSLRSDKTSELTGRAREAFISLLPALRPLTLQYLPETCNHQDFEDAEADAIANGIKYAQRMLRTNPESKRWSKTEWRRRIYSRFLNAIVDSARYLLYPMNIPRPLRFSLKKYSEALSIIRRYVQEEHVHNSLLYRALFYHGCNLEKMNACKSCELGVVECPVLSMETDDILKIHHLLSGTRKSLSYYAKLYRKSYRDWVSILESVKTLASSSLLSPDKETFPDLDKYLVLKELKEKMSSVHPNLFEIYCYALSDVDINTLNITHTVQTPRGWLNKDIKDRFGIESHEFHCLLEEGDKLLNEFRAYEGLPPVQRRFWAQSA
jgi:hypothetical protein